MSDRLREILKNILICLLALGVIVQAALAYSANQFSDANQIEQLFTRARALLRQEPYRIEFAHESVAAAVAARPTQISVKNSYGRLSLLRDFSALDGAYERLGGLLGEALERTDAECETFPESDYLHALQQPGIFFRYAGQLPTQLLAEWLGVETKLDVQVSALTLCLLDGGVHLCLDTPDGILRCRTELDSAQFSTALEADRPDGSAFVCERSEPAFAALRGSSLLSMAAAIRVPGAAAEIPTSLEQIHQLAIALGFNPYGNTYQSADNATVYEETTRSLQIWQDGRLALRNSDPRADRFLAASTEAAALSEFARSLLELLTPVQHDARLYLTELSQNGTQTVLHFDYMLNGICVQTKLPHAATFVFSGRSLQQLDLLLRTYTLTGSDLTLLPERQAAAILTQGSELTIRYQDTGSGVLTANWFGE